MEHGQRPLSLEEFKRQHPPVQVLHYQSRPQLRRLDPLAVWITTHVGTIGFFLIIFTWTALWLGWNVLAPVPYRFDPPMGFVLWLFISNMLQIFLMPLIMVGQNIQGRVAEARAENDLAVNMQAEEEIELVLQHLEYQNAMLIAMVEKLGAEVKELKNS